MIKKMFFIVVATSWVARGFSASPPSQTTKEEALWNKLSESAKSNFTSDETLRFLDQFYKQFIDHPKSVNVRYLYAERHFKLGEYQKAAVGFEKFLAVYPKHELADSALYRLGECYLNLKIFNSARAAWERFTKEYKSSAFMPDALEKLATLEMRAKEWGKADDLFQRIKKEHPDFARQERIREMHGVVHYHRGEYAESAQTLDGAESEQSMYYRGLSLFSLKLFEDSVAALARVVKNRDGSFAASAGFLKAEGFFQKKNYNVAASEFASFVRTFPSSDLAPYAELRQASCHLLVRNPTDAIAAADRSMKERAPFEVKAHAAFLKAMGLLELERYGSAADLFGGVVQLKEFPEIASASLLRKAWAHKKLGQTAQFESALKTLEQQYPSSPQMALARFIHGAHLYELGKWEDAGGRFEACVLGHPYTPLSEAGLALMTLSYTKAARRDQLVTAANSALKIFEKNFSSESIYWRAQSYYYIGKAYHEMERFKDGIPFLEKVTTQFSDHPLALHAQLLLAWCYVEVANYEKAREKARVLLDNPKTPKPLLTNAAFLNTVTFFNGKDYDKALIQLTDFLKQFPSSEWAPQARYMMGLSYHQKKVFGSAIDEWARLIKDYPDHSLAQDAYLHIGDLYFKSDNHAKAIEYFKGFRDRWPKSKYAEQAMWQELQAYFNGKDDEAAIKVYPAYIEKFPNAENVPDARNQLEMVYYRRGEKGDPKKLEEFLSVYPKSAFAPAARFKLGDMALEQKAWNRAIQEMEQFVRDYPHDKLMVEAQYGLGLAYENVDDTEKAIVQYRNLMTQFAAKPTAVDAAFRLGSIHFKKERFKEALDAFQFAVTKKMSDEVRANIHYNMALCYENLGRFEEAAAAYGKFASVTKNPDQSREALLNAGILMKKAEQHLKATSYFQQLLKDPGSQQVELQAVNLLAESYKVTGKQADAIKTYEKLVGVEPASSDLRLAGLAQLAYLYEQKKEFQNAIRIYEKIAVSQGKAEWVDAAKQRMDALVASLNQMP